MITEELKKDMYDNSAGDCWASWAKSVGIEKYEYSILAGRREYDLTIWDTCPRLLHNEYISYKDAAGGRICAAHHLLAGPYNDSNDSNKTSNECTCEVRALFNFGCQCGGE